MEARWPHGWRPGLQSGPGSSPGRGHSVVFLGKTLHSRSASPYPGVGMEPVNLMLGITL